MSSTASETSTLGNDPIISTFIDEYARGRFFYSTVASLAAQLCEKKLEIAGIRAIVTHRAKTTSRLEAKLYQRSRGQPYKSVREIRSDIVDLAGVRIALYFPNDGVKVGKIIKEHFHLITHKPFPPKLRDPYRGPNYAHRFDGYLADHYRVNMDPGNVTDRHTRSSLRRSNPVVEIQVASVLMHAWAEVNHDLVYKELNGMAPPEEQRILDAVNGLVHTGEVLLQQLQLAVDGRIQYQNECFRDQFELRSFLERHQSGCAGVRTEKLDVLLEVLRQLKLDSPKKLLPLLPREEHGSKVTCDLALKILDHIIQEEHPACRRNSICLVPRSLDPALLGYFPEGRGALAIGAADFQDITAQRRILNRAIGVADAIRYPARSILINLKNMPAELRRFHQLWSDVELLRPLRIQDGLKYEVSGKMVVALEKLWTWFEDNLDLLFQVSLKIARLGAPDIVEQLVKLQPSVHLERTPEIRSVEIQRPPRSKSGDLRGKRTTGQVVKESERELDGEPFRERHTR